MICRLFRRILLAHLEYQRKHSEHERQRALAIREDMTSRIQQETDRQTRINIRRQKLERV